MRHGRKNNGKRERMEEEREVDRYPPHFKIPPTFVPVCGLWILILILTLTQTLILSRSTVNPLSLQQKNTYKTTRVLQISDLTIHIET